MTTENYYNDFIDADKGAAKEPCLVMFHTDWCPHCVELIPEWNKLASKNEENCVAHVQCDWDECEDLCNIYKIRSYPTVLLLED